jgi:hypothetical protein
MSMSQEVRAAIGGLVIEMTWIEYLAARLVVLAGRRDNEMELLKPGTGLFKLALQAAEDLRDADVAQRTRLWVREAEDFQYKRHEVVHSIVLYSRGADLALYHPRSGTETEYTASEIADLAGQASRHADEGTYMSLFDWPRSLRRSGSMEAVGEPSGEDG